MCFVIIKLLCRRFSAVILKRIQFMLFFFLFFFLLTHPGQRRHSGDSSYWRRPRDGGRQNKEQQGVHARTYGTTHLFNSHTHRELYVLFDISFAVAGLVVKFWLLFFTVEYTSSLVGGGRRRRRRRWLKIPNPSVCVRVAVCGLLDRFRLRLRCHIYSGESHTPRGIGGGQRQQQQQQQQHQQTGLR